MAIISVANIATFVVQNNWYVWRLEVDVVSGCLEGTNTSGTMGLVKSGVRFVGRDDVASGIDNIAVKVKHGRLNKCRTTVSWDFLRIGV